MIREIKTEDLGDGIRASSLARRINMFNLIANDNKNRSIFNLDTKKTVELEKQREKLIVFVKKNFPNSNPEELIISPKK